VEDEGTGEQVTVHCAIWPWLCIVGVLILGAFCFLAVRSIDQGTKLEVTAAAVSGLDKDIDEIKTDVKEILKFQRKRSE
jgi:hypothetical protein